MQKKTKKLPYLKNIPVVLYFLKIMCFFCLKKKCDAWPPVTIFHRSIIVLLLFTRCLQAVLKNSTASLRIIGLVVI